MKKRKRKELDSKDVVQPKKKGFTIEDWLRSSSSNATLTMDGTTEDNVSSSKENAEIEMHSELPLDRLSTLETYDTADQTDNETHSDRQLESTASSASSTSATCDESCTLPDCEMHSEEDNDTTLTENDHTDIETQSNHRSESSASSTSESFTLPDCFEKVGSGRKNIRCKVCFSQKSVVGVFVNNSKHHIPAICTQIGTQNRKATVEKHLQSLCHNSAISSQRLASLSVDQIVAEGTIERGETFYLRL